MPSDDHNIPPLITTDLTADDDTAPPQLTTSSVQNLSPTTVGGLLAPHSPAGPRSSLDTSSSPVNDDGYSFVAVPPSPTLSSHSSVHFGPTSLAVRDNKPEPRSPSILLSPDGVNTHSRKGSNATFVSDTTTTEADHSLRPEEELRHVKSNTTSVTHVSSRCASRAKRDTADSEATTAISEKGSKRRKGAGPEEQTELDMTDTDPTPFHFRPKASGAGVSVSSRHGPALAITLTAPKGQKSTNWSPRAMFAASLDARRCTYGDVHPQWAKNSLPLFISSILGEILANWFLMLIEIAVQILLVFVSGVVFQATGIVGREWGVLFVSGLVPVPLGIFVRLLLGIGKLLTKLGLLYNLDFLPTDASGIESQMTRLSPEEEPPVSLLPTPTTSHGVHDPANFDPLYLDYSNERSHETYGDLRSTGTVYAESSSSSGNTSFHNLSLAGQVIPGKGTVTLDSWWPFAKGGNSNIYRGTLIESERKSRVAVKMIISDDGLGQPDFVRLDREARVWVQLNHPNLVPFIGLSCDISKWPCLVSPLYEWDVGACLRDNPSADRKTIILGVASGLEYLHAKEVIHGDLKVSNVFVDQHGVAYIGDFGLSKILNHSGYTTRSVGTVPYMAPELLFIMDSGRQITHPTTSKASDVYSFGLLALEILTSERPKGRPSQQLVTMKMFSDLRPKRTDYLGVPDEIWSVLNRCWESDPDARPSASALRLQLVSALNLTSA